MGGGDERGAVSGGLLPWSAQAPGEERLIVRSTRRAVHGEGGAAWSAVATLRWDPADALKVQLAVGELPRQQSPAATFARVLLEYGEYGGPTGAVRVRLRGPAVCVDLADGGRVTLPATFVAAFMAATERLIPLGMEGPASKEVPR